jgi:S-adenosylmethionine hydrolase
MIMLFTDFGLHGPYTGQMKAVLHQMAPGILAVDLFADAPVGNPMASAYLLAVYAGWFPAGTVFLCVIDPGVGGARPSIIVEADGQGLEKPTSIIIVPPAFGNTALRTMKNDHVQSHEPSRADPFNSRACPSAGIAGPISGRFTARSTISVPRVSCDSQ